MRHRFTATAMLVGLLAAKATAQTTIYSTFGPGDSYDHVNAWATGLTPDGQSHLTHAAGFTFGGPSGATLFDLSFAAARAAGETSILVEFVSGSPTGSVLESWNVVGGVGGAYSLSSLLHPVLTSGESYFLRLSSDLSYWGWFFNDQNQMGLWWDQDGTGFTFSEQEKTPAFAVRATEPSSTVPEPATMTLLATGLAGIAASRRRRA
jgi:hypothetical protein